MFPFYINVFLGSHCQALSKKRERERERERERAPERRWKLESVGSREQMEAGELESDKATEPRSFDREKQMRSEGMVRSNG